MAILKVEKTACDKVQKTIDRFSKIDAQLAYDSNTSLAHLVTAKNKLEGAIDARNAAATAFDAAILAMNDADAELSKLVSSFLILTGNRFTKDSDEYVWAGGTRQSEAIEKAKMTRLDKKKAKEEEEKKATG
jgi:hypothetical protein